MRFAGSSRRKKEWPDACSCFVRLVESRKANDHEMFPLNSFLPLLAFGVPGIQELIVIALILVLNGVWIWSLIHCCLNKRLTDSNRIVGIVVIALLNVIGTFLYFVFIPRIPSQGN